MGAEDQRTSAFPQYTTTGTFQRGATTAGGTLPKNGKGTLPRGTLTRPAKIVSDYTPSYEPNPNTLDKKPPQKKKAAKGSTPTYIDDGDDEFDYLNY